jgi:alpha-glucosidase (family GH31 glycosyl hydrolase)
VLQAIHGLDTMPLYLREGAVIRMGPDLRWVGERPTDPLTVVVAPLGDAGRTELTVPVDGRHRVEVDGHPGRVVLDGPAAVELRT